MEYPWNTFDFEYPGIRGIPRIPRKNRRILLNTIEYLLTKLGNKTMNTHEY